MYLKTPYVRDEITFDNISKLIVCFRESTCVFYIYCRDNRMKQCVPKHNAFIHSFRVVWFIGAIQENTFVKGNIIHMQL